MKRSNRLLCLLSAAALTACPAKQADAPTAMVGTVVGQLLVTGQVPAQPGSPLPPSLAAQCGELAPDLTVQVGGGGELANAVVFVADAPKEPLPASLPPPFIDQRRCAYLPAVVATRAGAVLQIKNSDPLIHNVRVDGLFNVAMPLAGMTVKKPLPTTQGPLTLHCDVHPWMRADVYAFEHGRYAVTGPDGRFRLEGVQVGERPITVWHARWPARTLTVKVEANRETVLDARLEAAALQPR